MSALIECDSIQGQVIKTRTGFPGAVGADDRRGGLGPLRS
jgi:hypothetical protein